MNQRLLDEARAAHARGWALTVLNGKVPMLKGWQALPAPALAFVENWVAIGHNLGLRTGAVSGVDVADFDTDEHDLGELPHTPTVRTSSRKLHVYLKHRDGVRNGTLGPKIDVRGDGGQVVYPGSIHPDTGEPYTWLVTPDEAELAEWPQAWLERLRRGAKDAETPRASGLSFRANTKAAKSIEEFNADPDWRAILEPHGWAIAAELPNGEVRWRRPGKDTEHSATTGASFARADGTPLLHCFSTHASPFEVEKNYDAFRAYALLHCGGNHGLAMKELGLSPKTQLKPEWPTMSVSEMYGLAGRFVRLVAPHTDADPAALYFSFLVAFGIAIGRNLFFRIGATRHFLNLFVAVIGATARARKGTSLGWVEELFELAAPDFMRNNKRSGVVSGEGLIDAIRDPMTIKEPLREKGTKKITGYQDLLVDEGVKDKRLFVVESEFARVCAVCGREGNTLSPVLRDAFDGRDLRSLGRKQNKLTCTEPHMGLLAHVTIEELLKTVRAEDLHGGLINRFVIVCAKRTRKLPIPTRPPEPEWEALVADVRAAIEWARSPMSIDLSGKVVTSSELSLSPEAEALWRESYDALTVDTTGDYGAATARSDALTRRVAAVITATDKTTVTQREHMQAALDAWAYGARSAAVLFPEGALPESEDDRQRRRVRELLAERGPLSERDLTQAARELRLPGAQLELLLRDMVSAGVLTSETASTGGRPSERFSLAPASGTERKSGIAGESEAFVPRQVPESTSGVASKEPTLEPGEQLDGATGEVRSDSALGPIERTYPTKCSTCGGAVEPSGRVFRCTACWLVASLDDFAGDTTLPHGHAKANDATPAVERPGAEEASPSEQLFDNDGAAEWD